MATREEIEQELKKALNEIGDITPWFDGEVGEWIFSHKLYPVEYGGLTAQEVVINYPLYLKEFIKHRLEERLDPLVEKVTLGHGGKRIGAGRPKNSKGVLTTQIRLPLDIANWIRRDNHIEEIRKLMACSN